MEAEEQHIVLQPWRKSVAVEWELLVPDFNLMHLWMTVIPTFESTKYSADTDQRCITPHFVVSQSNQWR